MSTVLESAPSTSAHQKPQLFSTCPQSKDIARDDYLNQVINVARWSEAIGCKGILVYTDNGLVDNWSVAQVILEHTERIAPLIAIQPIYMHPYMVAKRIATFAHLFGRKVYLNMLAGGFKNDLLALGDDTVHDERYERVSEYTMIIKGLLSSPLPFSFEGKYYHIKNLKMTPFIAPELFPGVLISGSSEVGIKTARTIGASIIRYPKAPEEELVQHEAIAPGIRVGIIARDSAAEAWCVAYERFPENRKGQLAHQLAMKVSDSHWHKELSEQVNHLSKASPYWMGPFSNYQSFCPYLVGSYKQVADELKSYFRLGFETFIIDIPPTQEELEHIRYVFDLLAQQTLSPQVFHKEA